MSGENTEESSSAAKNLPDDKKGKIKHLQEIVGGLDEDECVKVMEENEWNLEQAVHKIMDIPMAHPDNVSDPNSSGLYQTETARSTEMSDQLIRRRPQNINVESRPFNHRVIRLDTVQNVPWYWQALYILISPFQRIFHMFWYFISAIRPYSQPAVENPLEDVRRFIRYFSELDCTVKPEWREATYGECVAEAKTNLKLLIVYLHEENASESESFSRDIICTQDFVDLCRESDVILWGCAVSGHSGGEGRRVLHLLGRGNRLPMIGVIGVITSGSTRLGLLARLEGYGASVNNTSSEIVAKLRTTIRATTGPLLEARADRRARQEAQLLRDQQDRDYQESLLRDREREAAREAKVNAQKVEDAAKKAEQEKEAKELQNWTEQKAKVKQLLPLEPDQIDDTLLVKVKFPSGKQYNRRFYRTDSIKVLYYFIMSQDDSPKNFQVTSFPNLTWPCEPKHKELQSTKSIDRNVRTEYEDPVSFKEFGIEVNSAVFVTDLDA